MPFDTIETARVKTTGIDKNKCVTATLDNCPEEELPQCTTHQMVGFQSRPLDGKADAVYAVNGDVAEVLNMEDPAATKALATKDGVGEIEQGETRLFSTGGDPQGILLKDAVIRVGVSGTTIRINTNGSLAIDAAAGQNVIVNGGELRVGRLTDPVNSSGAFVTWAALVRAQILVALGGDIGLAPTSIGVIADGAEHFKA